VLKNLLKAQKFKWSHLLVPPTSNKISF